MDIHLKTSDNATYQTFGTDTHLGEPLKSKKTNSQSYFICRSAAVSLVVLVFTLIFFAVYVATTTNSPIIVPSDFKSLITSFASTNKNITYPEIDLKTDMIRSNFDKNNPQPWLDTDGNRIEAHAAGVLQSQSNGKYYLYGENKKTESLSTHGVNCYSSYSLAGPWKFEGAVLKQSDIKIANKMGPYVVERPKVIYNKLTKKYVLWFHIDDVNYGYKRTGIASSPSAIGPFTFKHAIQPDGIPALDMNLWEDPQTKEAFFIRSCDNSYAGISRLTSDYMNTTGIISTLPRSEGMAFFRLQNGTYYLIASHLSGWYPNPLILLRNDNPTLDNPKWVDMGNPTNSLSSFNTQPTFVISQTDINGNQYFVYLGDNWMYAGSKGLVDAGYVWLPFWFTENNTQIELRKQLKWSLKHPLDHAPTKNNPNIFIEGVVYVCQLIHMC